MCSTASHGRYRSCACTYVCTYIHTVYAPVEYGHWLLKVLVIKILVIILFCTMCQCRFTVSVDRACFSLTVVL